VVCATDLKIQHILHQSIMFYTYFLFTNI